MAITLKIESVKLKLFQCFCAIKISTIISLLINYSSRAAKAKGCAACDDMS